MGFIRSRRRGLTFVELLIAVGLVVVLLSIALPALSRARKQSEQLACAVMLRQIGTANSVYADTFGDWYAPIWQQTPTGLAFWTENRHLRQDLNLRTDGTTPGSVPDTWLCPRAEYVWQQSEANVDGYDFPLSLVYGMNSYRLETSAAYNPMGLDMQEESAPAAAWKRVRVRNPAQTLMAADATDARIEPAGTSSLRKREEHPNTRGVALRHGQGEWATNGLFFDGHVQHVGDDELFDAKGTGSRLWTVAE